MSMFGGMGAWGTPGYNPDATQARFAFDPALMRPATPQRSVDDIFSRLINPTNPLGQMGQALLMSGGGQVGRALALMQQQQAMQAQFARQSERDALDDEFRRAQLDRLRAPEPVSAPQPTALMQNAEWFSRLSPEERKALGPLLPNFQYSPDGIAASAARAGAMTEARAGAMTEARVANTPTRTPPRGAPKSALIEGQTATNPATGQRIVFSKGRWRPL
jgi:hypothetical protein